MKILLAVLALILTTGCMGGGGVKEEDAKSLLETLEFDTDECGQFQVTGNMQAGTTIIPWVSSDVYVNLDKRKPCTDDVVATTPVEPIPVDE